MKSKGKTKIIIITACAIVCLLALALSLYFGLRIYLPLQQEQKRFAQLHQLALQSQSKDSSLYDVLKEQNEEFVGWLTIPDTGIDYPVMKSCECDPEKYLHRDFDGNDSTAGTPFIGACCTEQSDRFVIYGLRMKTGTMFGKLEKYQEESFAKDHSRFYFETPTEVREYRVFAAVKTKVGDDSVYPYHHKVGDGMKMQPAFIEQILKDACMILSEPPKDKQIVLLSTRSYHTEDGRFFVAAYREK